MRKREQLLGLPVVRASDARVLGRVWDVRLSEDGTQVEDIVLQGKGVLARKGAVSFRDIVVLGEKAVVVRNCRWQRGRKQRLGSARMLDTAGNEAGTLRDFWFNENTGRVQALEMSRGVLEDLTCGRAMVQKFAWAEVGDELVVLISEPGDMISVKTSGRDA
nr:PRC-barrel domain-containing protein [bacterium]